MNMYLASTFRSGDTCFVNEIHPVLTEFLLIVRLFQ